MYPKLLIIALAALFACGCKDPRRGQSSANEAPVPDGRIVLLKRKHEVGAFILQNQTMSPEQTGFYWYYRSDGKGTFAGGDPAVSTGFVSNASQVAFSTFKVQWSINSNQMGWIYFSAGPTEFGKKPDYAMCITTETNLAKIDANARSWRYRTRPRVNMRALIDSQIKK